MEEILEKKVPSMQKAIAKKLPDLEKIREKKRMLEQKIPKIGILKEFKEFLKEYKVVGLAVAFIIGAAATAFVQAVVNNIIMPLITPFVPGGEWQTAKWMIGPFVFGWGAFLSALINFIIIAFVVFIIAKVILKEEKVTKK
jgi:large conductance mechanosensitive channel